MKTFNVIVFFLSFLSISLSQETHIESNEPQQNVASSINLENPDSESVREQRSFLKKKLCKGGGLGGGLFGKCKGHQGSYSYGHYNEPSGYGHNTNDHGYGHNTYDHGYGGNYGGSSGYGGSHGYNNYDHGGGYYNSKPSYGSGYGYTKPGLTYSIGGYSKSPSYGSYGGYGKSPSYGGGYHSGYNSYNSDYSSGGGGGYGKLSSYTGHGYSSGGYNSDEHPYNYMKYGSYSSDDYSSHNNYGTKSYNTNKYDHHKNHGKTYGKNTKSETSHESSSSEEDDGKFTNKGGHKKDHHHNNKGGSIIPVPFLPVVNQPVIYVPPVPSISVVQPVVHRDYNSLYAAPSAGSCGSSHYSADYSGSICSNPTYYAPLAPSIHHHGGTHQYTSGPSVYQTVTPTHASSAAILPAPYSASAIAYPAPLASYYSTPASTYPTAVAPISVNYGNVTPYPGAGPTSGGYVSPTYTVTSFDVQTITSPYQHVIPNEVKTFAKSGSSMAKANAPGGYVASAKASSSSDSSRLNPDSLRSSPDSLRSSPDSSRLNRNNDEEVISSKEEKDKRQAESDYKQQEDYYYLT